SRNRNDYDLALYVANWPAPRSLHWQTLLTARAIENQAYVAGCMSERCELGEQREALLAVTIPEEKGSFLKFCQLLGGRMVTEFN
ncbi:hypothetical protein ONQ62_27600, partial [Salmonella enterica subsp. enterica serovar Virginia]|nr:hypothetical protein [Salmonella enterica subsp. enterica serovar Virginia]